MHEAISWYEKAAAQHFPSAQFQLGFLYYRGKGVEQNSQKAIYWFEQAAAQGNVSAADKLADIYDDGEGVPRDDQKAVYWYTQAAKHGSASAHFNLGLKYLEGEGVARDPVKAYQLMLKASLDIGKRFSDSRDLVKSGLTQEQITEMQTCAIDWQEPG